MAHRRSSSASPWTVFGLQRRIQHRRWRPLVLWLFLGTFILGIFYQGLRAGSSSSSHVLSSPSSSSPPSYASHPITRLMSEAEDRFRTKVKRQSKSLKEAMAEYTKRYKMPPPKGFDRWWEFAQKWDVVMIDEYDAMMRDLQPFYDLRGHSDLGDFHEHAEVNDGRDAKGWALGGGAELRRRIAEVAGVSSIDLVRVRDGVPSTISINKDGFIDDEVSARARGLKSMLGKFVKELPDMDFPVNAKAEGRVIVPWDKRDTNTNHSHVSNTSDPDYFSTDKLHPLASFRPDWRGEGDVWDAWRRTCPPNSTARKMFSSIRSAMIDTTALTKDSEAAFSFSPTNAYYDLSFCDQPHLHYTQGHFFSDWRTIGELYPVMSPARARGFADIKIPSHYYYGSTDRYTYGWDEVNLELKETDRGEVAWGVEGGQDRDLIIDPTFDGHHNISNPPTNKKTGQPSKINKIFWRGATTGGGNSPPGFSPLYQRHRAVRMSGWDAAGDIDIWVPKDDDVNESTRYQVDVKYNAPLTHLQVPHSEFNRAIMDIAFVKATNPKQYPGGLSKLMEDHRFAGGVPLGGHWQYKYLLDLDGMSYSGRFMSFLASDSVPVKSTVYEEFFGEWIEPWLHYIPLSASYDEIYNIYAYFSGIPAEVVERLNGNATGSTTPAQPIPGAPDGDARLRRIARAGKQWKRTIGRTLDMESYVYRLALEWARLCADDREAMSMRV